MENNKDYNVNIYYSEEEVLAAFTNYFDEVKQQSKVYVFTKDSAPLSHYAKDNNVELHHSGGLFAKISTWLSGKAPFHDQLVQLEITSENIEKYKKIIANGGTIVISRADSTATTQAEVSAPQETLEDVSNETNSTAIVASTEKLTNREKFASTAITDPEDSTFIASTIEPIELKEDGSEILPELISDAANPEEEQLDLLSVTQESAISPTAQQPQDTFLLNNQNNESNTEQANTNKQSFPYNPTEALEDEDDILSHPASMIDSINASDNLDESQLLHANLEPSDASNEASQVSKLNDLQSIDLQDEPQLEGDISISSQEVSSNGYETEQIVEDYENGSTKHSLEKENVEQISSGQEDISLTFDDRHPEITSSIAALEEADPDSSDFTNANVLEAAESIEHISPLENHSDQKEILLLVEENTSELNINNEIIHLSDSLQNTEEASDQLSSERNNTDESIHFTIEGEDEVMTEKESFPRVPEEAKDHPGEILSHLDAYESAQEDLPEAPHPLENLNEEEEAFRVSEEISAEYPINATDINVPQSSDEQEIPQETASSESELASTAEPVLSGNTPPDTASSLQLDSEPQLNGDIEVSVSEEFESEKKQLEKNTSYNQEDEEIFQVLVEESNPVSHLAPNDTLHRPDGLEDEQTYEAIVKNEHSTDLLDETIGKAAEYRRHDLP